MLFGYAIVGIRIRPIRAYILQAPRCVLVHGRFIPSLCRVFDATAGQNSLRRAAQSDMYDGTFAPCLAIG